MYPIVGTAWSKISILEKKGQAMGHGSDLSLYFHFLSGRWKDAGRGISSTPDGNEFGGVTDFGWVVQGKFGPEYVKDEITGKRICSVESNWSYEFKWRLGIRSKKLELDQEVRKCREQRERRRFTGGPYPASNQQQPRALEDHKRQAGLKRYFAIRLGLVDKIDPRLVRLKSKE
ncbi:hypothetical protein B0H10DRAFT_1960795 [Mycena sp. CBHHK59/15]|nr:hypothetical protein B0H10DRAFT_1960795 [Mycena sp. CBHHK59/15]